jgi:CRP-like cAMP-binding protein
VSAAARGGPAHGRRQPLQPVEKARRLREHPLFNSASATQLLDLVANAGETTIRAGQILFREHDPPALFHIIEGEVRLETPGATPLFAGPGATVGLEETLAGISPGCRATVIADGHALRLDRDALFDVLADHIGLLQGVFSGVLSTKRAQGDAKTGIVSPATDTGRQT